MRVQVTVQGTVEATLTYISRTDCDAKILGAVASALANRRDDDSERGERRIDPPKTLRIVIDEFNTF
jgi:hypothetical protein